MPTINLIHWVPGSITERVELLQNAGYEVESSLPQGSGFLRQLAEKPPAAIIIDLARLPSQGRDMAVLIRRRKGTRHIPLVFVGGQADKVAGIRLLLPDAVFASWEEILQILPEAIAQPPQKPLVPDSAFAGYAGKSLSKKLGIKAGMAVHLVAAPKAFAKTLGPLPEEVQLYEGSSPLAALTIWFTRSSQDLLQGIEQMAAQTNSGDRLWIAWPKKSSGVVSDLTQQMVRETGLGHGLVDYKISAIDKTWSALLFTRRS
jgi:CheY-like chemotaxis protein